ncbi:MAG TPA: hypothetical protein VFY67_04870 [Pyrinomonadaceae bacterium]|nr:hypothetical protein [Pyrinomonadaceae bacterium]
MTNVNCFRCGVLNLVADEMCRVCGIELRPPGLLQPEPAADRNTTFIASIPPLSRARDVIEPTIQLFLKNLWLITRIVFVVVAPFEVFKALSVGRPDDGWQTAGVFALGLLCKALIAPALIYALMKVMQTGTAPGVNEAYRWGLSKLGKLILCALMAWGLTVLGLVMLIIPGIILTLAFELVFPMAILEKHSPKATLRRSYELTKGHRWNILVAGIVMAFIVGVIGIPVTMLFPANGPIWQLNVVSAIITDILEQSKTVLSLVIYLSILRTLE